MAVRAKFYVNTITRSNWGQNAAIGHTIKLNPVISGSEENQRFYQYTPGGSIELTTVNEEAAKQFEIGGEYYVDFTKAD